MAVSATHSAALLKHQASLSYIQDCYTVRYSQCEKQYADALALVDSLRNELVEKQQQHDAASAIAADAFAARTENAHRDT